MGAPYRRGWKHGTSRGQETKINCSFCGQMAPRWKMFTVMKGFRINDPVIRQQMDPRRLSFFERKEYACPGCARHRGIVQAGKAHGSRPTG